MNEENNFNTVGETNSIETPVTPIEEPVNNASSIETPVTPIEEPVVNNTSSINNNQKKNRKGLIVIVIILLLFILGIVGYFLYSEGYIFNKKEDTKVTNKKTNNKKDSPAISDVEEESKEQYIKVDISKYKENTVEELGTFKINGTEYKISFKRWNCKTAAGEVPDACYDHDYLTSVYVGNAQYPAANLSVLVDGGLTELAVIDDKYLFVNTGEFGDGQYSSSMMIYESGDSFKEVEELKLPLYKVYNGYNEDNGKGKHINRNVGYVDSNTIIYGKFEEISSGEECKQRYIEYTVTIKDGQITTEKTYTKDNVHVSAQCS